MPRLLHFCPRCGNISLNLIGRGIVRDARLDRSEEPIEANVPFSIINETLGKVGINGTTHKLIHAQPLRRRKVFEGA